jgi:hypothetical protein
MWVAALVVEEAVSMGLIRRESEEAVAWKGCREMVVTEDNTGMGHSPPGSGYSPEDNQGTVRMKCELGKDTGPYTVLEGEPESSLGFRMAVTLAQLFGHTGARQTTGNGYVNRRM